MHDILSLQNRNFIAYNKSKISLQICELQNLEQNSMNRIYLFIGCWAYDT